MPDKHVVINYNHAHVQDYMVTEADRLHVIYKQIFINTVIMIQGTT